MRHLPLTAALVITLGCSAQAPADATAKTDAAKTDEATKTAKAGDAKPGDTKAGGEAGDKPDAKPDARSKAKAKAKKAPRAADDNFNALLNEGRKLSKAKDYPAAIAKLHDALRVRPGHSAALGELGWAAFNAGDLAESQEYTERALRNTDKNKRRGSLHYNLGRVHEARGDVALAIAEYERSLSVRDNDIVEGRLAGLRASGPADRTFSYTGGADALCDASKAEHGDDESLQCTCELADHHLGLSGDWSEVGLLVTVCDGDWQFAVTELAVRESGGWRVAGSLLEEYGGGTDSAEGTAKLALAELDPSPGKEMKISVTREEWTSLGWNDEIGGRVMEIITYEATVVCGVANGGWCVSIPTKLNSGEFGAGEEGDHETTDRDFSANLSFDGAGGVTIDTSDPAWQGTKKLRALQPVDGFPDLLTMQ